MMAKGRNARRTWRTWTAIVIVGSALVVAVAAGQTEGNDPEAPRFNQVWEYVRYGDIFSPKGGGQSYQGPVLGGHSLYAVHVYDGVGPGKPVPAGRVSTGYGYERIVHYHSQDGE